MRAAQIVEVGRPPQVVEVEREGGLEIVASP